MTLPKINPIQATSPTMMKATLSAKGAQDMADAIIEMAVLHKQAVTVVIVDNGGNLILFKRMDGATLGTTQAALAKADTSLKLNAPTDMFKDWVRSDLGEMLDLSTVLGFMSAGFSVLEGGQMIYIDGEVVGAIGVSGIVGGDVEYINAGLNMVGGALPESKSS